MATLERSKSDVPARTPFMRRAVAGLVLLAAAGVGLYLLIHVIQTIIVFALVIVVAAAVLWALKTIVW